MKEPSKWDKANTQINPKNKIKQKTPLVANRLQRIDQNVRELVRAHLGFCISRTDVKALSNLMMSNHCIFMKTQSLSSKTST